MKIENCVPEVSEIVRIRYKIWCDLVYVESAMLFLQGSHLAVNLESWSSLEVHQLHHHLGVKGEQRLTIHLLSRGNKNSSLVTQNFELIIFANNNNNYYHERVEKVSGHPLTCSLNVFVQSL